MILQLSLLVKSDSVFMVIETHSPNQHAPFQDINFSIIYPDIYDKV